MSDHVIRVLGLTKKYGNFGAVKSLDLSLDEGDVFGFIGPNGAGKTTTMRMLAPCSTPPVARPTSAAIQSTSGLARYDDSSVTCPISLAFTTT